MIEVPEYIWEALYVMKALFDHGRGEKLLAEYRSVVVHSDEYDICLEILSEAVACVFADTRRYYNEDKELEVWVFFDPVFQEFYSLCEQYEQQRFVPPKDNPFRMDLDRSIEYGLSYCSYDYGYHIYDNPAKPNGCRIVLMLGCEFGDWYSISPGLLDIREAYHIQVKKLKEELGLLPNGESGFSAEKKEAA